MTSAARLAPYAADVEATGRMRPLGIQSAYTYMIDIVPIGDGSDAPPQQTY